MCIYTFFEVCYLIFLQLFFSRINQVSPHGLSTKKLFFKCLHMSVSQMFRHFRAHTPLLLSQVCFPYWFSVVGFRIEGCPIITALLLIQSCESLHSIFYLYKWYHYACSNVLLAYIKFDNYLGIWYFSATFYLTSHILLYWNTPKMFLSQYKVSFNGNMWLH